MFTRGLLSDMIRHKWQGTLALVDIDPVALEVADRLARKMVETSGTALEISAYTDIERALAGATCVVCTIGVGGRRAWEQDVLIPRKHGIFQPVGDTVMPGGASRALRMIPAMVKIAQQVQELAPDALFFNYGNPMSAVCRGVRKATGANVVGLCHGVWHVSHYLADVLGVQPQELSCTALGINHLTWFTRIEAQGRDAMPRLREIARERVRDLSSQDDPFTWELTDLFGAFPAVLDRHVTEFFPHMFSGAGSYYGKTLGVESFSFEGTISWGDQIFAEMKEAAFASGPLPPDYMEQLSGEHEQVVEIIESIRGNAGRVYSANLPNTGQVPNLPADAVIECPAVADATGLHPIPQGAMSAALAGTLADRFQWVETVVEAALTGDPNKVVEALVIDGAVSSIPQARRLAQELLKVQAAYLPQFSCGV